MFDQRTRFIDRLGGAVDLMIDFATLGEYGFEPVAETAPARCSQRHRRRRPAALAIDRPTQLSIR
jgi:hypothetical protein